MSPALMTVPDCASVTLTERVVGRKNLYQMDFWVCPATRIAGAKLSPVSIVALVTSSADEEKLPMPNPFPEIETWEALVQ